MRGQLIALNRVAELERELARSNPMKGPMSVTEELWIGPIHCA